MAEVICPENEMEVIPPEVLLDKVMEKKNRDCGCPRPARRGWTANMS